MSTAFRAPGRVNLMGDHTDYNAGFVLPAALQLECRVVGSPRSDGRVRARSADHDGIVDVSADGSDEPSGVEPEWGRYVAGVVTALAGKGRAGVGLDAEIDSSVPPGSGLSSSAALEVACALALCNAAGLTLDARELALACQEAEHLATGVPSGIMDQVASLAAQGGHALLLDCRTITWEPVAVPTEIAFVVVHSGLPRKLELSAYAERRAACEALALRLGLRSLRDASPEQVADEPLGRHVVSENDRVHEVAAAVAAGELSEVGRLFDESHASLRDDFRVSTPQLDLLVTLLVEAGAAGARLTGAGFGGCVVAACERPEAEAVGRDAARRYATETGLEPWSFVAELSPGAGPA